jgi:DNA-binding transcriptional MerR regulator
MPRKNYFTISEIAKEFKVKKSHIRSYEKKGLISPRNNKLGRRIYNQHDRARLELIFHFELIDYSLDQISELIGIPEVNLDKMERYRKSLDHGEKKLEELEKRSKEIKFPDRISVMNEINMMRKYLEQLRKIETLKSLTEKKPKRKHIRMIPVYLGLSLILIIAGYFFYQGGKILNLAQKKPPKAESSPVYRYPVPPDDTGDQQNVASQPAETPDLPLPIQGDSFIEESRELVNKEPIIDKAETVVRSKTAQNIGAEKVSLLSTESTDAVIDVKSSAFSTEQKDLQVLREKALLKENGSVKKWEEANLTQSTGAYSILKAGTSVTRTRPAVPPKPSDSLLKSEESIEKKFPTVKGTAKNEKEKKIIQPDTEISSRRVATISKVQKTAPGKKEKATVAEIEEEQQTEILAPYALVHKEILSAPEQQETISPEDKQTLDTQVKEDAAIKLEKIDSNVIQSTRAVALSDEKAQTDYKPLTLSHVEKTKLNIAQDNPKYQSYIVSLHYTSDGNREKMEELAALLKKEGFDILGIEKVDYQYRDIRYFHNEDKQGALFLQKISNKIFTKFMNIEDINIKIKNLSKKYKNARKGALELWVNF